MNIKLECRVETLGDCFSELLDNLDDLSNKKLVINSNSGKSQEVYLNSIETLILFDEAILIFGKNGNNSFLNLKNVLSIIIL